MKIAELFATQLTEGSWVVKNKDGKEKRFKNSTSPEALAWKDSSTPKKSPIAKYSDVWWDEQHWRKGYSGVMPDKKITNDDLEDGVVATIVKDQTGNSTNDFYITKTATTKVGDTTVATAEIRVTYEFDMKDMGYDDDTIAQSGNEDGRGLESMYVKVRRDVQKPEKLIFVGHGA